ncbi:MAG TPA: hypothetical protein VEB43_06985 [Anaeromyxobacter sp.]|nr:hypothetical protein [Anaeromyxobacter sp.]
MRRARALLVLAALCPTLTAALEPRYDHRDLRGVVVEPLLAHDTVAVSGQPTRSSWRPAVRIAYGWDALGEGNELFLGAQARLAGLDDPDREKVRLALDARYRSYFGTEQWKTFFELGVWAPVSSRLAVGPLVGLGVAYDFSRSTGLFLDGTFATAFGQARIASFQASAGWAYRF